MALTRVENTPIVENEDVSFSSVDEELEASGEIENSLKSVWKFWGFVTIEPMLLLQMVALSSCMVNVQNYYIESICNQEYNNETFCKKLNDHQDEERHVEEIASLYATYRGIIEAGLPIIFSLFLGSWSDKHGSKVPMVLPLFGYTVSTIMYAIFAHISNVDPGVLLIASVPVALTGGLISFIMSAFRYIADITTVENRSFRIAMAEGCWFLGSPFGLLGSAQVLKLGGYTAVFVISTILYGLSLLYTIFFVRNDKPFNEPDPDSNIFKDMFNISALKDTVRTVFRKRAGYKRLWIILLLITICFRITTLTGGFSVTFLYARSKLSWNNETFSTWSTVDGAVGIAGSGLAVLMLMKVWKIPDATIGLISSLSYLGGTIIIMLATQTWMMYLAGVVQMFCGLITIVIRSMISKIVSKDELGKVFSFLASGEATMPLISAPLYNLVFMKTVSSFPGAIYLMSAAFVGCIVISFIYFFIVLRNVIPQRELEEDSEEARA